MTKAIDPKVLALKVMGTTIDERIARLINSEKVTKKELGFISRELLEYVPETNDIGKVNRLLSVLTPMNKMTAIYFFKNFLPFRFDEDSRTFGKKLKGEKTLGKYSDKIETFLKD